MRKRAEVENSGKNEATGPRKPKDILGHKVSVKVSKDPGAASLPIHSPRSILTRQWGDGDLSSQRGNQRGGRLTGFCMQDQFIFYFLFLLATSIQISKYSFFFLSQLYPVQMFYSKIICSIILLETQDAWFITKFSKLPIWHRRLDHTCGVKRLGVLSKPSTL